MPGSVPGYVPGPGNVVANKTMFLEIFSLEQLCLT